MIQSKEHAELGYAELTINGKVDRQSFDRVVFQLGPFMKEHGKIGLLKHVISIGGISPSVLWDDLKFAFGHLKYVGPVAVVSDKSWIETWTKLSAPFWGSEVRFFEEDDLEEAREWMSERMAVLREESASA